MQFEEAKALVRQLAAEWAERQHVASVAADQATKLAGIIAAYIDMFPELALVVRDVTGQLPAPGAEDSNAPKGAEAVRIVLQENVKVQYYVSEMVEELRQRGWLPESDNPANAVRAALDRLSGDSASDVHKQRFNDRTVTYIYDPDRDPGPDYDDEEPF
jgi:ATP/maltotriose-dependent transcriptional regulator MalT